MVKVVDGAKQALKKEMELKRRVAGWIRKKGVAPKLVSLVMVDDAAGRLYSKLKQQAADRVGIVFEMKMFEAQDQQKMKRLIKELNSDSQVQGVMVQRPGLKWGEKHGMKRKEFETWWQEVTSQIDFKKDVDGLRQASPFLLGVVKAVRDLVVKYIKDKNKKMVVVGSRGLMGRRIVKMLKKEGFEVLGVDKGVDLRAKTRQADGLISATGKEGLIKADMVKTGAVVIDVGWPKGDVVFETVKKKAAVITPVPGGVGPLTVIALLENLVDSLYTSKS